MIYSINYATQVISAKIGSGINWLAPTENRIISPLTSIIKSAIKFYWAFHCNIQRGIKDILWRYVHWLIKKFSFDNMGRSTVFYHYWDKRWLKVHWKIGFMNFSLIITIKEEIMIKLLNHVNDIKQKIFNTIIKCHKRKN